MSRPTQLITFDLQKYLALCKSLTHGPVLGRRRDAFRDEAFAATGVLYQKAFGSTLPARLWRSRSPSQTPAEHPPRGRKSATQPRGGLGFTAADARLGRGAPSGPAAPPPVARPPPPAPQSHAVKRESEETDAPASKKSKTPNGNGNNPRSSFKMGDWLQSKLFDAPSGRISSAALLQMLHDELPDVAKSYKSDGSAAGAFAAGMRGVPRDAAGKPLVTQDAGTRDFRLTDAGRAYVAAQKGGTAPGGSPPAGGSPSTQFSLMLYGRSDLSELRLRVNVRPDTTLAKVIRAVARSLNCVEEDVAMAVGGRALTDTTATVGELGFSPESNRLHLKSPPAAPKKRGE